MSIRSAIEFDVTVREAIQPGDNRKWPNRRHQGVQCVGEIEQVSCQLLQQV